jgi:hypothetical protein
MRGPQPPRPGEPQAEQPGQGASGLGRQREHHDARDDAEHGGAQDDPTVRQVLGGKGGVEGEDAGHQPDRPDDQ